MDEKSGEILTLSKNAFSNIFDFVDELEYLEIRGVSRKIKAAADLVLVRRYTE